MQLLQVDVACAEGSGTGESLLPRIHNLRGHCKDSSVITWQRTQMSGLVLGRGMDIEGWVGCFRMFVVAEVSETQIAQCYLSFLLKNTYTPLGVYLDLSV